MNSKNDSGFSLLSAVIAIAVAGIVVAFVQTVMLHAYQQEKHFQIQSDLLMLRSYIDTSVNCSASSLSVADCTGNTVELRSASGVIVSATAPYSRVANYELRTGCEACPTCPTTKSVVIQATKMQSSSSSTATSDPLTGQLISARKLYKTNMFVCPVVP